MDKFLVSTEELAKIVHKQRRTVQRWRARGLPVRPDGLIDLREFFLWYQETFCKLPKSSLDKEIKKVKLEREKLALSLELGESLPRSQVEEEWAKRILEFKQGLIALEFRISGLLSDKTGKPRAVVQKILREEVRDLLNRYARDGEYTPSPTRDLPFDFCEEAYRQFWEKLMAFADRPRLPSKIEVKIAAKRSRR